MLFNHLKFAIRIFLKDKFFSTLNILGLALGISVSIILMLILQNDLTYDQHYVNHERIYRLGAHYQITGSDDMIGTSARELGPILKDKFPEIEALARVKTMNHLVVKLQDGGEEKVYFEEHVAQTDPSYFQVFNHEFLAGNVRLCLADPHNVVITQSTARKYFNDDDPLDKTLSINNEFWKVSGVISDFPENTHLKFDFLLSGLPETREGWDVAVKDGKPVALLFWNPDVFTYLLMPEHYNSGDFYSKFHAIYKMYFEEASSEFGGSYTPVLQPLDEIHFSSFLDDGPRGDLTYLLAIFGIGLMIVLLACINYMNLSTAKAVKRATEIAIRKISGSRKRMLLFAILTESTLLSLISLVLAIVLVFGILNLTTFNQLIGKNLTPDFLQNPMLLWGSLGIALGIGIISGLYPALYLPGVPAVLALKGAFKNRRASLMLRKVLITTQFAISIFVVACTLFMRGQIDYVRNRDLGFNKDNLLVLPVNDAEVRDRIPAIKNDLLTSSHILAITASQSLPGMGIGGNVMLGESETGMQKQGSILGLFVGDDYLKTMGITLISGRDFQPGRGIDEDGVYIANEAAVRLMHWGNDALGKKVAFWGNMNPGKVVGVVKDFNSSSLHRPLEPMFIVKGHWQTGYLQIRMEGEHVPETIRFIRERWPAFDPDHPFEYFFLDQKFNEQYKSDEVQNQLLSALSYICIFISLLGLFGLSAFAAIERTTEIGVRKVLGASVPDILLLLSKNVLFLVMLASVIAIPVSNWVVTRWMGNFAYQTQLNYMLYLIVTLAALALVFLIVLFQSLRTARSNPVDSLKYE